MMSGEDAAPFDKGDDLACPDCEVRCPTATDLGIHRSVKHGIPFDPPSPQVKP